MNVLPAGRMPGEAGNVGGARRAVLSRPISAGPSTILLFPTE